MFLKEIFKKKVNLRFWCFRKFVAGKHPTEFLANDRIMLECIAYFISIHLTIVIVDDISVGINVNDVFKFSVTHNTHGSCGCSGELDVNSEISFLHDIKMRRGSTHVRRKVKGVHSIAVWKIFLRYIVYRIVVHFSSPGEQGGIGLNKFRVCIGVGQL